MNDRNKNRKWHTTHNCSLTSMNVWSFRSLTSWRIHSQTKYAHKLLPIGCCSDFIFCDNRIQSNSVRNGDLGSHVEIASNTYIDMFKSKLLFKSQPLLSQRSPNPARQEMRYYIYSYLISQEINKRDRYSAIVIENTVWVHLTSFGNSLRDTTLSSGFPLLHHQFRWLEACNGSCKHLYYMSLISYI